jgi:iron complex outermembrane receptor protein
LASNVQRAERVSHWIAGLLLGVSPLAFSLEARAQTAGASQAGETRVDYDIPAQPLSSALGQYARQSGLTTLLPYDRLAGEHAPAVRGSFTREQALRLLLANSTLRGEISSANTLTLEQDQSPQSGSANAEAERVRAAADAEADAADEEIVVTGTRIRGAAPAGSNLIELSREELDATGRLTLQDALQTLPQNFAGSQNEGTVEGSLNARSNFSYGSTVDLRGLGADATLTLVNGRRLAPAGVGNYVDISIIPLAAVERIEVLADGASATYGSDAVGGVVNIILNDTFEGAETRVYASGTAQGGAEGVGFSHLFGADWASGRLTAAYDYRDRRELDIEDRDFLASSDFRPEGSNFSRTLSNPGNIIRIGATPVSLAIPEGQDGTSLSESDLIAGVLNLNELNEGAWLLPQQTSHSIFLSAQQDVTASFSLSADLIATDRQAFLEREQLFANIVVPETNAYRQLNNLFPGQGPLTIAYFFGPDLGPVRNISHSRAYSTALSADLALTQGWTLSASLTRSQSREAIDNENFFDAANIAPALASSNLDSAFNPFADGSNTNPAVLAGLTFDIATESEGEVTSYGAVLDGPLWSLPGGEIRAAFGLEQRRERFSISRFEDHASGVADQFIQDPGARTVDAIFAELYVPLISADNGVPLVHALTLSASARREEASDYGASTTPRIGLRWALFDQFALRASWGQSFKGPLFDQLLGGTALSYLTASAAQDPLADNGSTGVLAIAGANRDLAPERAETWTAGFDFEPGGGFRLSATYYDIDFADRITSAGGTFAILRNPAGFESIIYRDPSPELIAQFLALGPPPFGVLPADGVEVIVDRRLVNLSSLRVRGVDVSAGYAVETDLGQFSVNLAASNMLQYETMLAPGATPVSALNTMNGPVDFRGRATFSWQGERSGAALTFNYVDDYRDTLSLPAREIDAFRTVDFRLTHAFDDGDRGPAVALNVLNAFDEDPPFANNPTGFAFDAANASPLGRVISLELRQRW